MKQFTDATGRVFETSKEKEIAFIEAMEKAGIPWYTYSGRGMFGRVCPSANTSRNEGLAEEDIIAAAYAVGVKRLNKDNIGFDMVLYTG